MHEGSDDNDNDNVRLRDEWDSVQGWLQEAVSVRRVGIE